MSTHVAISLSFIIALSITVIPSCHHGMNRADERFVLVQPMENDDSVLSGVTVTVKCDGDSVVVPFDRELRGYRVPEYAFRVSDRYMTFEYGDLREIGRCFTYEYGNYTGYETRISRRVEAVREGRNEVKRPLKIYLIRPTELISIPLGGDRAIPGRTVPNAVYVGWFTDTSHLDSTITDLTQACNVIVERVLMIGPDRAVLLLDRGVRKIDSPILRHLRSRSPQLNIGLVATAPELVATDFRYGLGGVRNIGGSSWKRLIRLYTNRLTIEFKERGEEALKVLKEYGLEFLDYDGQMTYAVADPGVGEGILEIAQKLKERPEVKSVSVHTLANPQQFR